jgi:hypothetical protein
VPQFTARSQWLEQLARAEKRSKELEKVLGQLSESDRLRDEVSSQLLDSKGTIERLRVGHAGYWLGNLRRSCVRSDYLLS